MAPTASSVVEEAQRVLEAVEEGDVTVTPTQTTSTTAAMTPPTTMASTTTTLRVRDLIPPPTTGVPAP